MQIKDRAVIVTGAGSGIGRAIALEFGRQGARVACAGRREDRLRETVAAIEAAGGTALAVPTDVADPARAAGMVERATRAFGRVDVLFNNAGSFGAIGPAWEVDPVAWWHDVAVNLRGTMLCCRAVLPGMLARDRGILINMSGGSRIPAGTGYSCSKAGVIRFTELLAMELRQKGSSVLAFVMDPGFVRTEMTRVQLDSAEGRRWLPASRGIVERGEDRPPEDCARATMRLVRAACPALSGGSFDPDTDFEGAVREAGK